MRRIVLLGFLTLAGLSDVLPAQETTFIPRRQEKPPNAPRPADEAARLMTVPEGFAVEVVAAEPDLVNPVAMAIDERGRFWVTESVEYPRREPGVGKDRVKVLEDTDGDGKADKFTLFMDGLNIPSGIAVGHGGVWVANAPDLLFVQDTDGDGKADKQEVVVTGFGRDDTHELPNSLTWGPDGWLYGLNGVFNYSHIKYGEKNPNYKKDHPGWQFTCAMFRIHPKTREFQVFCEGTSNPWGIAFNENGDAFVSACVIDHLWHLVETGYYHRQGGPYPPFTWKIESIVKHQHQKAAYCGITWFDSDAYPEQYRRKLYMGNIHAGGINVDRLEKRGSTYEGIGEPDFLMANDAWFMPVVQKTGPDGSLYILDWYDRYHCYQDANFDPPGVDRLKGRLYRIRYKDTPRKVNFDLAKESDDKLIELLGAPNVWTRETAQRLLTERGTAEIRNRLIAEVNGGGTGSSADRRRHALFAWCGILSRAEKGTVFAALKQSGPNIDPVVQAFALRVAGDHPDYQDIIKLSGSERHRQGMSSPGMPAELKLQVIVAEGKRPDSDSADVMQVLLSQIAGTPDDGLFYRVVWQNLSPRLEGHADELVTVLEQRADLVRSAAVVGLFPRIAERLLGRKTFDPQPIAKLYALIAAGPSANPAVAAQILQQLTQRVQNREIAGDKLKQLQAAFSPVLQKTLATPSREPLFLEAALLATAMGDAQGRQVIKTILTTAQGTPDQLVAALNALIAAKDPDLLPTVTAILNSGTASPVAFRSQVLTAIGRLDEPAIGPAVLKAYPAMEPELKPRAIELLTQRTAWAKALLDAVEAKTLPASVINENQARRLSESGDATVKELLAKHWGQVREGRNPDRELVALQMRELIRSTPSDPFAGEKVFASVCGQCHKLHGQGNEVGPDLTGVGRNDFTQLLSNVFDPSLVIGNSYRSYTVVTEDGRVLNGLLTEDSPQRIVLKVQGGKQEVVPRADIDTLKVSEISLMPEGLEKQLTSRQIADLFAYLTLDKHPSDPGAKRLSGIAHEEFRETGNAKEFAKLFQVVGPGFTSVTSGERGVGVLRGYKGRPTVVRTHPVSRDEPAVMSGKFAVPADRKTSLRLVVSHDEQGDWQLRVRANGTLLLDEPVGPTTVKNGWLERSVDLTPYGGQTIDLQVENAASGWAYEFGYWGRAAIVTE